METQNTRQEELRQVCVELYPLFMEYVSQHSLQIGDVEVVSTLDSIYALTAKYVSGGVEKTVLAPLKLLSSIAEDAAEKAKAAAELASQASNNANAAADRVDASITEIGEYKAATEDACTRALSAADNANAASQSATEAKNACEVATSRANAVIAEMEAAIEQCDDATAAAIAAKDDTLAATASCLQAIAAAQAATTAAENAKDECLAATQDCNAAIAQCRAATQDAQAATVISLQQTAKCKTATDNANDVASHAPYVGEDKYWYVWNNDTKTYDKTRNYSQGKGFHIKKLFASIAEMEAYVNPSTAEDDDSRLTIGDYVSIVSDVEDVDNAKLFIVESVTNTKITYGYQGDMSGARGFTGHTPQLSIGTITTGAEGSSASVSLSENGTDTEGNPKYLINFAIPRGAQGIQGEVGPKGDSFTYDDFTEEEIAALQKPAIDAAGIAKEAAGLANKAADRANKAAEIVEGTIGTIKWDWANIEGKPTTVAGYGITDLSISEGIITIGANSITPLTAESGVAWSKLTGVPTSFTPSSHTHAIADITNLSSASVNYASSAGNADTLDGNHASAFASASHTHSYIPTSASCNKNWAWSGQGGQPTWLWGSNDGSNCYVWNPSNFSVSYASSAGNADTLDGYHAGSFATASHTHTDTFTIGYYPNYVALSFRDSALSKKASETYIECWDGDGGWWNWMANKWMKSGSSDSYVLLGGGGHKLISDFAMASHSHSYLPLSGGTLTGQVWTISHFLFNNCGAGTAAQSGGKLIFQNAGNVHACIATTNDGNVWVAGRTTSDFSGAIILSPGSSNTSIFRGAIKCSSLTQTSDVRMKNIISDVVIGLDDIVCAPLFEYSFRNDENMQKHIGTSAQYWDANYSGCFAKMGDDGYYSMEYANLGVAMGISIARYVKAYESKTGKRLDELERENKELKERLTALEAA